MGATGQARDGASTASRGLGLILLLVTAQWILYLSLAWDPLSGTWGLFNPDTYATLTVARTWAKGHPMRLAPDAPPGTMLSDLLSPLIYAPGYVVGFRSTSGFVLWSYLVCLAVSLGSALALWRFFQRFFPAVAVPATCLSVAFPGIYTNLYSTNFGFMFLAFWMAMGSLGRVWPLVPLAVVAGLFRPEGFLTYGFLLALHRIVGGAWRWVPKALGAAVLLLPHAVYVSLTGSLMPQGVVPQSVLSYHTLSRALGVAMALSVDQLKGLLLGSFASAVRMGVQDGAWLGLPPPLVGAGALVWLAVSRGLWLLPLAPFLLLLVVGDSLTVFAGLHFNRHLQVLSPLLFGASLEGLWWLWGRNRTGFRWSVAALGGLVAVQFLGTLELNERSVRGWARDKLVADYLVERVPHLPVVDSRGRLLYWADGRLRLLEASPSIDPLLARHVRLFWRLPELGEYLQRRGAGPVVVFSEDSNPDLVTRWLLSLGSRRLASFPARYTDTVSLFSVDLSPYRDQPPWPDPCAELDVGDFLSEETASYVWRDSLPLPVGAFLIQGEGFADGGRPGVVRERFRLPVPRGGGFLVARLRGTYEGLTQAVLGSTPATVSAQDGWYTVRADGRVVYSQRLSLGPGYAHVVIPVSGDGVVQFETSGFFNSFHYWVYPGDGLAREALPGPPDSPAGDGA